MGDSPIRGESAHRGESDDLDLIRLIVRLDDAGHGGCADDLTLASPAKVVDVAYQVIEHLEEGCGAPREQDQDLAYDLRAWAERREGS